MIMVFSVGIYHRSYSGYRGRQHGQWEKVMSDDTGTYQALLTAATIAGTTSSQIAFFFADAAMRW